MRLVSIRLKIVITIIMVLLITVSVSIFFTVSNQRKNLFETMRNSLSVNNAILNTVIKNIMLSGEAPIASKTMSDLRALQEFKEIEIYRTDGTVAFNDYSTVDAVNSFQSRIMFSETPRADLKIIDNPNFQDVLASNTPRHVELLDSREMEFFFPILNLPDCRVCHGTESFIRGVAHYKVSVDEIFRQINSSRNFLTVFFLFAGAVIAFILIWMMQWIVVKPVLSIVRVVADVGSGNLNIRTGIKSNDELGLLGSKLNEMISDLKDKRQLELANREIETRNRENKKYLDNINEGLLLLNPDLTISKQYSRFLTILFNREIVSGLRLSEFIYPDSDKHMEDRDEVDQFVKMIFEKTKTDMEMILSINPLFNKKLTIENSVGEQSSIIVDAHFQRIFNGDSVENVMVIFEDRTKIINIEKELEAAREKSQSELEQISVILRAGPESFLEFVEGAEKNISESLLSLPSINESESLNSIMRNLHTLKGSAGYMDLKILAEKVHEAESMIVSMKENGFTENDSKIIEEQLGFLAGELEGIKGITDRFSRFSGKETLQLSGIEQFFETLERMVEQLAGDMEKDISFSTRSNVNDFPYLNEMKDPVIHLIRNSIDHGIEDKFERLGFGKEGTAKIELEIGILRDGSYRIVVSDDGRGINFQSIKKRAVERGILENGEVSNLELAELLFSSSFSTREEVGMISGRGVGLDVVSDAVKQLKGTISIATTENRGTKFIIKLPGINGE
ncbi:MAG: ATP-binding protein [Spirochaetales bacterium]|nr:ATP-binding protein [Spirochaetales bacterium]